MRTNAWKALLVLVFLSSAPVFLHAGDAKPDTRAARNKIVGWVKSNGRFGPDSGMVRDVSEMLDADIGKYNNLTLIFSQGLLRSGAAFQINYWAGDVFTFRLSPQQAKRLDLKGSTFRYAQGTSALDERRSPPQVTLSQLKIENAENLNVRKRITGDVSFKILEKPAEKLALRISYSTNGHTTSSFKHLDNELDSGSGSLHFTVGAIAPDRDQRKENESYAGSVAVFVDLCRIAEVRDGVHATIVSNSLASLVDMTDPD
jgi:hypothetical protein